MNETNNHSAEQDENRQAFLRYLAKRVVAVEQRIEHYLADGWDARGMAVLNDDVVRLASASGRYDLLETSQNLLMLAQALGGHIARGGLPDPRQSARMLSLMAAVTSSLAAIYESSQGVAQPETPPPSALQDEPRPASAATPPPTPAAIKPATAPSATAEPTTTAAQRVYYLNDGDALAVEVGQSLESNGFAFESVDSVDQLSELLTCMSPQVLLVGASHLPELTAIGAARRDTQQRSQHQERIQMVVMAAQDNVQLRQAARRAGVDVLLFAPFEAAGVVRQIQALLTPAAGEKIRVLIVEDDHAQGVFAQSVLTNAGMHAQVEPDPMHVLESLRSLHPDLVLMDLHMPETNGMELTALIREHPAFMHTPIVFLSGDSDPQARLAAMNAGGDDFLSKPIRPKHLIAAVQNRARTAHNGENQGSAPAA